MKMQLNDIFKHRDHKNTAYVHVNFTTWSWAATMVWRYWGKKSLVLNCTFYCCL